MVHRFRPTSLSKTTIRYKVGLRFRSTRLLARTLKSVQAHRAPRETLHASVLESFPLYGFNEKVGQAFGTRHMTFDDVQAACKTMLCIRFEIHSQCKHSSMNTCGIVSKKLVGLLILGSTTRGNEERVLAKFAKRMFRVARRVSANFAKRMFLVARSLLANFTFLVTPISLSKLY